MKPFALCLLSAILDVGVSFNVPFELNNPFNGLSDWSKGPVNCLTDNPIVSIQEDVGRTTCEIVEARGFKCEKHQVTTSQGYQIELHRIPPLPTSSVKAIPVLLQTGLIGTSADFIMASESINLTDTSLMGPNMGLELAKRGYDVWLSNNRGSEYAQTNEHLSSADPAFWDFSFQDISEFDIPSILEFVLSATGSEKLHYIGHSQGSAVMFALLSQTDRFNDAIASYTAISPITRIGDAKTLFRAFIALLTPYLRVNGPIFGENFITSTVVPLSCSFAPFRPVCEAVFFSLTGPNCEELEKARLSVYLDHQPTSTARKNLLHFHQLFQSNKFQKFDYGPEENRKRYAQSSPPEYDLKNISHPAVYIITGLNDWFVPESGLQQLEQDLAAREFYYISNPEANHMDPLIGKTVAPEVNRKILEILAANE